VNFKELLESWRTSAAAPRSARSWSVHLPVEDAARLEALAELFPGRTPEQLVTELLAVALREVAAAMPYVAGERVISTDEQGDPVYEDVGPTPRFMELTRRHRRALEGDAGAVTRSAAKPARRPKAKAARPKRRRSR
jgi:hypothetical protein